MQFGKIREEVAKMLVAIIIIGLVLSVWLNWDKPEVLRAGAVAVAHLFCLIALPALGLLFFYWLFQLIWAIFFMVLMYILLDTNGPLEDILDRYLKG